MKTFSKEPGTSELLLPASCPICGTREVRPLWDLDSFAFSQCVACGHIYQNPRPRASDLADRYDAEYLDYEVENAGVFLNLMLLGLRDLGFDELEAGLPLEKRFLDVGCATGALVEYMGHRGWNAEGIEVCSPAAEYGRSVRRVCIHTGFLEDVAFPAASFDLVHASHLLEHVAEPGNLLAEVRRILKPGGYCVIVTPNTASLQAHLFKSKWRSAIADHAHLFSLSGLLRLLRAQGLAPLRHKTWGGIAQGLAPAPLKRTLD